MGKRDSFWATVPTDEEGQFFCPDDSELRTRVVRDAFGAKVIGALEAVLHSNLEIASGQRPEAGSHDYEAEAARREVFASMSEAQRAAVKQLVKKASFGTLYWILVKLEHFPLGNVDFNVEPFGSDGRPLPKIAIEETELHHLYFEWVERFSDHGDK